MNELMFVKIAGRWLVNLPDWRGALDDLEMVAGADTLLDEMAQGNLIVTITLSTTPIDNPLYVLTKFKEDAVGGTYRAENIPYTIWLCNVTKFVFQCHPDTIYIADFATK